VLQEMGRIDEVNTLLEVDEILGLLLEELIGLDQLVVNRLELIESLSLH
jgi:hypothetical protein